MAFVSTGSGWNLEGSTPWASPGSIWSAMTAGAPPPFTPDGDAGTGPTVTLTGNRYNCRLTIKTGASPSLYGGALGTFALSGYEAEPFAMAVPRDAQSWSTFPTLKAISETEAVLEVAGQLEASTEYSYDIVFQGP